MVQATNKFGVPFSYPSKTTGSKKKEKKAFQSKAEFEALCMDVTKRFKDY